MNTFLLTWNPLTSNYKSENFRNDMQSLTDGEEVLLRWKLGKDCKLQKGERFIMVKTAGGNKGICMAGYLFSTPFKDDDGSEDFCSNLDPLNMVNCDQAPVVSLEQLEKLLPEIDWKNLPQNLMLTEEQTCKVEQLWLQYLYKHQDIFNGVQAAQAWDFSLENFETINPALQEYYMKTLGNKCEKCGKTADEVNELAYHFVLGEEDMECKLPLEKHLHCYCDECWF